MGNGTKQRQKYPGWGSGALADTQAAITDGREGWHIQPYLRPLIKAAMFLCPSQEFRSRGAGTGLEREPADPGDTG